MLFARNVSPVASNIFILKKEVRKMFKKNDTVLYGSEGVCAVNDITQRQFKDCIMQYYVLKPVYKEGATVFVPVENKDLVAKMKRILSVEDIHQLIEDMPHQTIEWIDNDNLRKEKYREILKNGNRKQLIQLIRTIYLKQEELKKIGKKIHATDDNIFKEAERILYEKFAYVLNIHKEEVVPFIFHQIELKEKS